MPLVVTEIRLSRSVSRVTFRDVRHKPGVIATLFDLLSRNEIPALTVSVDTGTRGKGTITLYTHRSLCPVIKEISQEMAEEVGAADCSMDDRSAIIEFATRTHLGRDPASLSELFDLLMMSSLNVEMVSLCGKRLTVGVHEALIDRFLDNATERFPDAEITESVY